MAISTPPPNLRGSDLLPADFARLAACGISRELAESAFLRRVDSQEGREIVGQRGNVDCAGVLYPYVWPGENHVRDYRLRRDRPDLEQKPDGGFKEKAKYICAPGRGNMLYFHPATDPHWLENISIPVVLVEGEKKCLSLHGLSWHDLGEAAERPRWLSIGMSGVWNFLGVTGKTVGPDGERRNIKGVISDLQRIVWKGRRVTILFDTNVLNNDSVQAARQQLTAELQRRGAIVFWFSWPEDTPAGVNGIDDLIGKLGADKVLQVIEKQARPCKVTDRDRQSSAREFSTIADDHYRLTIPNLGVILEVDRLRREHSELHGELTVKCDLPGAKTVDGVLSVADFNLSSAQSRTTRAKLLAELAKTRDLDWAPILEEFCQKVLRADRDGGPAVDLRTITKPEAADDIEIEGLYLPRRHPTILFGDGESGKSYVSLYLAGVLAKRGLQVALFDWELDSEDHRARFERIFGDKMPRIMYARCERPLVYEVDRLRRIIRDNGIDFAVFDSVAFACDGPPESSESAGRYFRALRQLSSGGEFLRAGTLHIAHVTKNTTAPAGSGNANNAYEQKPFGSIFWHNGARCSWFVKKADESTDDVLRLGFFNRKANLDRRRPPVGFNITFTEDRAVFSRGDVSETPDLAERLTIKQRMMALLRRGSWTAEQIAEELDAKIKTVQRTVQRDKNVFTVLSGGKIGLASRMAENG